MNKEMIKVIRNKKVIFDSDLAKLYGYKGGTKSINLIVRRNEYIFTDEDCFQLTEDDINELRYSLYTKGVNCVTSSGSSVTSSWDFETAKSNFETANFNSKKRSFPYVFTMNGVLKISSLVRMKNSNLISNNIIKLFDEKHPVSVTSPVFIENLIYEIRGKQVMLDTDLARLYECQNGTKDINKAVKRNIQRFPSDFYFQLTFEEINGLSRFQFGTLNRGKNVKYLPYVFTEQGVAMLASVLNTSVADNISVSIMRAFVSMKKYINKSLLEQKYINEMALEDHDKVKLLEESFKKFEEKRKDSEIFFSGQIYDAYYKINDIFKKAKTDLIIIDAYADNVLLNIIKDLKVNVTIITRKSKLLKSLDIERYNKQYKNPPVIVVNNAPL